MSREKFEADHSTDWKELHEQLVLLEGRKEVGSAARVVTLYRRVCQHLSLARHRHYGADLVERLNLLTLRGHQQLYRGRAGVWKGVWEFALFGFPREVRRNWRYVLAATVLFLAPFLLMLGLIQIQPELVYSAMPPEMVGQLEQMYRPGGQGIKEQRQADSDVLMFGFYIWNNIGIAFRTFAGGIVFGLGSIFFLVYNGVVLGAASGHLTRIGYTETFWPFVIGHGAFELTAIVLSGATGLKLGYSLLSPGRRSRSRALVEEARDSMGIVYGFTGMLVIAAFIEAFWSPRVIPIEAKLAVGAGLWVFVLCYFTFMGRSRGP